MNDFRLTEGHIYKIGDKPLTGVTNSLQVNFGRRDYWNEWHAQRGTAVHLAIHYLEENRLNWDTLDERIKPRIEAYQKFRAQTNLTLLHSELSLFSKRYQFAGTIDKVFEGIIIIDIKGTIEPVVELQLAAYSILWEEKYKTKVKKAAAVELKDNGGFNMKWFTDLKRSQRIYLATLTTANWKIQNYNHKES